MPRPIKYDKKLCMAICTQISNGEAIIPVLKGNKDYPDYPTFCKWKRENEEAQTMYIRAREDKADALDSRIEQTISDMKNGTLDYGTARVIIDTLKWRMVKFYPKMYGDKLDVTSDSKPIESNVVIFKIPDNGRDKRE